MKKILYSLLLLVALCTTFAARGAEAVTWTATLDSVSATGATVRVEGPIAEGYPL